MQQVFLSRPARALFAGLAIALAIAGLTSGSALADDKIPDDRTPRAKSPGHRGRWWLQIYAHTMQEEAFLLWMDRAHGSSAWRHTMQEQRINQLWAWWCKWIWNPAHGMGSGFGSGHG